MEAREYLERARKLEKHLRAKILLLEEMRREPDISAASISGMPHCSSSKDLITMIRMNQIVDYEREIKALADKLRDTKVEIHETINQIEDADCVTVLELRYLGLKSWEQIIDTMCYSRRSVFRIHEKGLKAVEELLNK